MVVKDERRLKNLSMAWQAASGKQPGGGAHIDLNQIRQIH
jgi:hypothetical protein